MKDYEVVGHSYNNSIFCMDCSAYDAEDLGHDPEDENGNPIHAIFASTEDADDTCTECGCNLLTGEVPDSKEDVEEWARAEAMEEAARQEALFPTPKPCKHGTIDFAQSESAHNGMLIHVTCHVCGVSGSYPIDPDDINWPDKEG